MPKTLAEINAALQTRYSGPIKMLKDFAYIPWDQAVKAANDILGPDCYDVEIQSYKLEEIPNVKTGEVTYGYSAVVRLTVRPSDAFPIIRDGLGFNELEFTHVGRAMIDPSIKGAASGGLLRALSLLGDAFGLFLYNEKGVSAAPTQPATNGARPATPAAKPALSPAQENKLRNCGFSADLINQIHLIADWRTRKQLMDSVFAGASVGEVMIQFGLQKSVAGGSGYPVELDEEEAPF